MSRQSMRSLRHRWYREQVGPEGIQRRRALLAYSRDERAAHRRTTAQQDTGKRLAAENAACQRRVTELSDKLQIMLERVPVYARIQRDEQHYGRTLVITVAFNPDVIIRTLVRGLPWRSHVDTLDLDRECHYLVDFAAEKIRATLRNAAAEYLGIPGAPR